MQSFGDLFANNRLLALGLLLAAVAVILAVGIGLFRLTFGRRLHMSGGRTRQPRLGVVDAFDLDRQRQLVIVRRDNVEHLLMIGGPNDVLIEAAIVRAPANLAARDKDNGVAPTVGIPAPTVTPASVSGSGTPVFPPAAPSAGGDAPIPPGAPPPTPMPPEPQVPPIAAERERGLPPAEVSPALPSPPAEPRLPVAATLPSGSRPLPQRAASSAMPPRPPVAPAPPRPGAAPPARPNFSRATPVAPPAGAAATPAPTGATASTARVEPALNRSTPAAPSAEPGRGEPVPTPAAPAAETRGDDRSGSGPDTVSASSATSTPVPTASQLPPRPPAPPRPVQTPVRPQPVRTPTSPPAVPRAPIPSLGSLEEEMAKLLGRPMPPPDQSNGS